MAAAPSSDSVMSITDASTFLLGLFKSTSSPVFYLLSSFNPRLKTVATSDVTVKTHIGVGSSIWARTGLTAENILARTLQYPSAVDAKSVGKIEQWAT